MAKKKNPRQIVNAGELIGHALSRKELIAVAAACIAAKLVAHGDDAKTLNLALAKLRKAYDYKGLKAALTLTRHA
jgi:hypothetical protein